MTANNAQGVDVLAAMDEARRVLGDFYFKYQRRIGPYATQALASVHALQKAREAVAELVEAVKESRAATQAFANDGHPFNFARYGASERRLEAALAKFPEPRP